MFGCESAEGWLTSLNNCSRQYRDNMGKIILAELHKLWKHHAAYLKDIHHRKDHSIPCKPRSTTKFEIGQAVVVTNHTHHASKPKYLMDYRILVTPIGTEYKTNINNVEPCTTLEHIENSWNLFLNSIKTKCQNHDYNLRPCN